MLALRGDIPLGETTTCGDFDYATDLVKFVRDTYGDKILKSLLQVHRKATSPAEVWSLISQF